VTSTSSIGSSVTSRQTHTDVLRRIFGPKLEEMAGGWRKVYKEEVHILNFLSGII
jgi:hypothetical protein